jgi:hypothetical protein
LFHIHIGYDIDHTPLDKLSTDILIGRLFDLFLTIPSHEIKPEPERIETYGKWGMIRSKDYGVECRTLSSYFTQPDWLGWVWDQTMKIASFIDALSIEDLLSLVSTRQMLGSTNKDATKVFVALFAKLSDIEVLKYFKETQYAYYEISKSRNKSKKDTTIEYIPGTGSGTFTFHLPDGW